MESCSLECYYQPSLHGIRKRAKKKVLRRDLGFVLLVIALTTLLVISVVKSSLALSLGLVGALSIVRFRTPIKEPEELTHIFLGDCSWIKLGADQREAAALGVAVILVIISATDRLRNAKQIQGGNLLVTLNMPHNEIGQKSKIEIEHATTLLTEISNEVNIMIV